MYIMSCYGFPVSQTHVNLWKKCHIHITDNDSVHEWMANTGVHEWMANTGEMLYHCIDKKPMRCSLFGSHSATLVHRRIC